MMPFGAFTLRGEGAVFCAGGDLKGFKSIFQAGGDASAIAKSNERGGELFSLINELPKFVLILVQGAAMAGGFWYGLRSRRCCCDQRCQIRINRDSPWHSPCADRAVRGRPFGAADDKAPDAVSGQV